MRWQLETAGLTWHGGLRGVIAGDLASNLLGCLLIGVLTAAPGPRARLLLWGAIGFCGSLTTFSSWMLQLVRALQRGAPLAAVALLLVSLCGGLLLLMLGRNLGRRCIRRRA